MSVNQGLETLTAAASSPVNKEEVSPAQPPFEDNGLGCERCGGERGEREDDPLCLPCREGIEELEEEEDLDDDEEQQSDGYAGPVDPEVNNGGTIIRGRDIGGRRTWAAKEPVSHKKRVLYQGEEDMFSESESEERDSIDDDAPDLLGYLGDFPGLTGITKISMLRAAANYLSSQQRAAKPFTSPSVPATNKKFPPAPKKKAKTFDTKKAVPYPNRRK